MAQRSRIILFTLTFFTIAFIYIFYPRIISKEQQALYNDCLKWAEYCSENDSKIIALNRSNTSKTAVQVQKGTNAQVGLIFTYRDLEAQLCQLTVDWPNKALLQPVTGPCPKKGIVSVSSGGRTGNQIWEYASVWAVARQTGLDPYVPNCIRLKLDQIFEQLTIPTFEKIADCPIELNTFVKSVQEWSSEQNQNIILRRYSALLTLVSPYIKDIIKEFRFTKELRDKAQEVLRGLLRNRPPKEYTFVGVHVRRTDYIKYLNETYNIDSATPQFFTNAMNYYRQKYHNCLFVYVSDDLKWCSDHFGAVEDAVITSQNTPAVDLAIMGACNHSIFDYGTYGEWGSILAGGEAITIKFQTNGKPAINFRKDRLLANWSRIS